MNQDFEWRDCVLIHPFNADFLRGKTTRIYDDSEDQASAVLNAIIAAFVVAFVAQFFSANKLFIAFCALQAGIWITIFGMLKVAHATARRSKAVLVQGELLTAKSDMAESEGTILTYRFVSPDGQTQSVKGYANVKPERFTAGDKLIILLASDGTHTVL